MAAAGLDDVDPTGHAYPEGGGGERGEHQCGRSTTCTSLTDQIPWHTGKVAQSRPHSSGWAGAGAHPTMSSPAV